MELKELNNGVKGVKELMELRHMLLWVYSLSSTPWVMNFWASGRVALCLSGRTNFSNFPNNFFNFCIK